MQNVVRLFPLERPLRNPLLVAAFAMGRPAGHLGFHTVTYLVGAWDARFLGSLPSEPYYNFTEHRPDRQLPLNAEVSSLDWHEPRLYLASPAERDVVLLQGFEPNFRWSGFAEELISYAASLGVRQMVTLRCFGSPVPHTRPAPTTITTSDPDFRRTLKANLVDLKYKGRVDINVVLSVHAKSHGWQTADLGALQPYYFPRLPNYNAMMSLIACVDRLAGTVTSFDELLLGAVEQVRAVEAALEGCDRAQADAVLREMERRYDRGVVGLTEDESKASNGGLSSPAIIEEIERIFGRDGPDAQTKPNSN
jgi:hypothetical protein